MKKIDWNTASKLGLIEKINSEVLHPLGLAMTRSPATGVSDFLLIADDLIFTYADDVKLLNLSDAEIKEFLQAELDK